MAKKTNDKVLEFLSGKQKLSELTREDLAELCEECPEGHWLKQELIAELRKHIAPVP